MVFMENSFVYPLVLIKAMNKTRGKTTSSETNRSESGQTVACLIGWLLGRSVSYFHSVHVDLVFCTEDTALLGHVLQTFNARHLPRPSSHQSLAMIA